jgi:hypothetical protein
MSYKRGAKRFISLGEMSPIDFTGFSASSQRKTQWPRPAKSTAASGRAAAVCGVAWILRLGNGAAIH